MAVGGRNIVWEWGQPRVIQGFFDLGPIIIPPLPRQVVLTDRADGTQWLVKHNTTTSPPLDGLGHVSISNVIPQVLVDKLGKQQPAPDVQVYPAFEEPYVATFQGQLIRLILRGQRLGLELFATDHITDENQGVIYIRSPLQGQVVKITLPSTFNPNAKFVDTLSWTTIVIP